MNRLSQGAVSPALSPEMALVLACIRPGEDPESRNRIGNLAREPLDWERLATAALHHRVMPLVVRRLAAVCPDAVPPEALKRLRDLFYLNTGRALRLVAALKTLLERLEADGIRSVPFKGPILAGRAYGDETLRQFEDLDILVARGDLFRALETLSAGGFHPLMKIPESIGNAVLKSEYGVCCENGGRLYVDLHWDLFGRYLGRPFGIDAAGALERADLEAMPVDRLRDEAALLYLCVHGAKHLWPRLESVCAVAHLIDLRPRMDWEWIERTAGYLKCRRMLALGVYLSEALLNVRPPERPARAFAPDGGILKLSRKIVSRLLSNGPAAGEGGIQPDFSLFHLLVRDSVPDALRHAARLLFTPSREDWQRFAGGGKGAAPPRLKRPVRLFLQLGAALKKGGRLRFT